MSLTQPRGPHVGASVHHLLNIRHEPPSQVGGAQMYSFNPVQTSGTPVAPGTGGPMRSILLGPSSSASKPSPDMPSQQPSSSPPVHIGVHPQQQQQQPQQHSYSIEESKRAAMGQGLGLGVGVQNGYDEKKAQFDRPGMTSTPSAAPLPTTSPASHTPSHNPHMSPAPRVSQPYASSSSAAAPGGTSYASSGARLKEEDEKSRKSEQDADTKSQLGDDMMREDEEVRSEHNYHSSSRPLSKADMERDRELTNRLGELQDMDIKLSEGFVIKKASLDEKEEEYYRAQSRMELTDHMQHFHMKIKNFANTFAMISVVLDLGLESVAQQIHQKVDRGDYKSVLRRHHQKYGSRPLNDPFQDIIYMTLDPILSNPFVPLIILGKLVQLFQGKATLNVPGLGGNAFKMPMGMSGTWPGMQQPPQPQYPQYSAHGQMPHYGYYPPQYGYAAPSPQYGFAPSQQPQQQVTPQPQQAAQPINPFAHSAPTAKVPPTAPVSRTTTSASSSSIPRPSQSAADLQNLDVVWKAMPYLEGSTKSAADQARLAQQHRLAGQRGFNAADKLYDP